MRVQVGAINFSNKYRNNSSDIFFIIGKFGEFGEFGEMLNAEECGGKCLGRFGLFWARFACLLLNFLNSPNVSFNFAYLSTKFH